MSWNPQHRGGRWPRKMRKRWMRAGRGRFRVTMFATGRLEWWGLEDTFTAKVEAAPYPGQVHISAADHREAFTPENIVPPGPLTAREIVLITGLHEEAAFADAVATHVMERDRDVWVVDWDKEVP